MTAKLNKWTPLYRRYTVLTHLQFRLLTATLAMTALIAISAAEAGETSLSARRATLLEIGKRRPASGVAQLTAALGDDNAVIRRTAVRALLEYGADAQESLHRAFYHKDDEVVLAAFQGLRLTGSLSEAEFAHALEPERQTALRLLAVQTLAQQPLADTTRPLLELANRDSSESVRTIAAQRLYPFPFHREARSIRWNADQILNVVATVELPRDGWRLKFDPQHAGHAAGWFKPDWRDDDWQEVKVGFWDQFGHAGSQDIGWYRNSFELPPRAEHQTVELLFETVAGSAWVWLNGEYAGQRLAGLEDWNAPFMIDVTPMACWRAVNQITIRVHSLGRIGGLAKPVRLEALKLGGQ